MKTLVLGGSLKPQRYSNKAIEMLRAHDVETVSVGLKTGIVAGVTIETEPIAFEDIHTVTLYLNPQRQEEYYDYIINLRPKRIIFNPGTENPELVKLAKKNGIKSLEACTLVLLSTGLYEKRLGD